MTDIQVVFAELMRLARVHTTSSSTFGDIGRTVRHEGTDPGGWSSTVSLEHLEKRLADSLSDLATGHADLAATLSRALDRYEALELP